MGKAAYIGVDGKSRKVKSIYIGVNGVARKVKKAYIGVNGVARLFYEGTPPLDEALVSSLIDFEYDNNGDGTVTLTDWKGTLNGISSSNLTIPNDNRIVL